MNKILDRVFSEGFALVFMISLIFGTLFYGVVLEKEQDAREDAQIVELVKHGTSLPEARCAVKGC